MAGHDATAEDRQRGDRSYGRQRAASGAAAGIHDRARPGQAATTAILGGAGCAPAKDHRDDAGGAVSARGGAASRRASRRASGCGSRRTSDGIDP